MQELIISVFCIVVLIVACALAISVLTSKKKQDVLTDQQKKELQEKRLALNEQRRLSVIAYWDCVAEAHEAVFFKKDSPEPTEEQINLYVRARGKSAEIGQLTAETFREYE